MKKVKLTVIAITAALGFSACGTINSKVFEMSPGVYIVSSENWMTYDPGDVHMDLMKKVAEYYKK